MKKVLIAICSPQPIVSAFFAKSLAETFVEGQKQDVSFQLYWSPDEGSYKNQAAEIVLNNNFDTLVFIQPHIQWIPETLISIINNSSLIEGVPTKEFYSPQQNFKILLNTIKDDQELSAKLITLDFIKIEKEVFSRIDNFVIKINKIKEDVIEQIPMYFYATADESGQVSQDVNFCLAVEKAEIPIEINPNTAFWEHMVVPHKTDFGAAVRQQVLSEAFTSLEEQS